jgi:hypothetical protein
MTAVMNEAPSSNNIAVLTRPHLEVVASTTRTIGMLNGCVSVVVGTALGRLALVVTHLHPFSSTFRLGEMKFVAARAGRGHAPVSEPGWSPVLHCRRPTAVVMRTSGLHTAPDPASEPASSPESSPSQLNMILPDA